MELQELFDMALNKNIDSVKTRCFLIRLNQEI